MERREPEGPATSRKERGSCERFMSLTGVRVIGRSEGNVGQGCGVKIYISLGDLESLSTMLAIRTRIVINFCTNASGAWSPLLRLRDSAGGLRVFAAVEEEAAGRAGVRESYLFADTIVRQTVQRCVQAWHGSSDVGLSWKCLWLFSRTRLGLLHVRVLRRAPRSADPLHTSLFPRRETINFISLHLSCFD